MVKASRAVEKGKAWRDRPRHDQYSFLFFRYQAESEFGDQRLRAHFGPEISAGDPDRKLRGDCCQANTLEPLSAVHMPQQPWLAAKKRLSVLSKAMLLMDCFNHRNEVKYDPYIPLCGGFMLVNIQSFHLRRKRVASQRCYARCRRGYLHLHKQ